MSEAHPSNVKVESDYEIFDQLILNHERTGKPYMRFAFTVQFWFMDGWRHEKRAMLVEIAKEFYDLFPDDMSHFQKNSANRFSRITNQKFPIYFEQVQERIPISEYFVVRVGDFKTEPANCEFMTLTVPEEREERAPLSYVELRFPLSWIKHDIERLMRVLLKMSNKLKPVSAIGGISPVFIEGLGDPKYYFPYLKRYPGLDYMNASWGRAVGAKRKIRGANWLTLLDDRFIDDLGGLVKLKQKLGEGIIVREYEGGAIIQAGPQPCVGDLENNIFPQHYRAVNKVLKHLRFEDYRANRPYLKVPYGLQLDASEESAKWLRRFDVEEVV